MKPCYSTAGANEVEERHRQPKRCRPVCLGRGFNLPLQGATIATRVYFNRTPACVLVDSCGYQCIMGIEGLLGVSVKTEEQGRYSEG